jgi:hypothetical protein
VAGWALRHGDAGELASALGAIGLPKFIEWGLGLCRPLSEFKELHLELVPALRADEVQLLPGTRMLVARFSAV